MDKIWLKSYEAGVAADINPGEYSSLVELLEESCNHYRYLPAFYNFGTTLTFQQIDTQAKALAAYFQQVLKLAKGDRVAIMLPNLLQYPIIMFACLRAGLTVVNINPLYTTPELVHQLLDSGAQTIFVLENFAKTVEDALPHVPLKNIIITKIGDLIFWPKSFILNFFVKHIKKKVPAWNIPNAVSFKEVMKIAKRFQYQPVNLQPTDIAFLQYTGGTTGISKGAVLTHKNIVSNILQAEEWFKPKFERGKEVMLAALPLYHIFSLTANCLFIMKIGGLNVLITNARDVDFMVSEIKKFKLTVITGVNTLFNSLLKNPNFAKCDFSALKVTLGGGMAVQRSVARSWHHTTGVPLLEAYGLTETSPCVTINPTNLKDYNGTVGLPVPSTEVAVFDNDGKELGIGEAGELGIKGPQVMRGYWYNEAETKKVFNEGGWLLTGDIASINENGYVKILERKKDMILVSGFNVYPNEIEDIIAQMPEIREVAVIGVPDENSGEAVNAFIVRDNPELTAAQIQKYCYAHLTPYKVPKHIVFVEELPKTNVGKVMRRTLRTPAKT